jgi:radical SAM protein with 4Fe4S-binding SPASM domain
MTKRIVLQRVSSGARLAAEIDDALFDRERRRVADIVDGRVTAERLARGDTCFARRGMRTKIELFEAALRARRERGEEVGPDDGHARLLVAFLCLAAAEDIHARAAGEVAALLGEMRAMAEQALLEAMASVLVGADRPSLLERIAALADGSAPPEGPPGPLRGVMTVGGAPDERVRRLTGLESVGALSDLITRRERSAGLLSCQVLLDTGCNQECVHCFLGEKRPLADLAPARLLLERDLPAAGLRPLLYYSEPFVSRDPARRREVLEIAARHQRRLLLTNAVAVDEAVAEQLVELGPFRVYVSILGGSAATHDQVTGSPGSFDRAVAGIGRIAARRDRGLTLCVNLLVTRANLPELEPMIDRCVSFGAKSIFLKTLRPGPRSAPAVRDLCVRGDDFLALVAALGVLRPRYRDRLHVELSGSMGLNFHTRGVYFNLSDGFSHCPAGRTMIAVHPATGAIYPCMMLSGSDEHRIGHWDRDRGVPVVDAARNVLGRLTAEPELLRGACSPERCVWSPICRGGCRAAAAAHAGGDLLAGHEQCLTRAVDALAR